MNEIKRAIKQLIIGIGMVGSVITIKNEFQKPETEVEKWEEQIIKKLNKAEEDTKQATDALTANNLFSKLYLYRIQNSKNTLDNHFEEETYLTKLIKEQRVDWAKNRDPKIRDKIQINEVKLETVKQKIQRESAEVNRAIVDATKFSDEITKETDEKNFIN